ncbi:MAG: hypothetical protein ACOC6F_02255 [bacterium]
MPRRMISPEIWRNEKVASLPDAGRLLFIGMFSNADDDGRLKASPRFLRATIFPYDNDKTDEQLRELRDRCARQGLIRVFSSDGQEYLDIPGWSQHQHIRKDRYSPSRLPGYCERGNQMTPKCPPSDNQTTPICQPCGNHLDTSGEPSAVKPSSGKYITPDRGRHQMPSAPEETEKTVCTKDQCSAMSPDLGHDGGQNTSAKRRRKASDPRVKDILNEMKEYLGYPHTVATDPIPAYGKEGTAIKRMLDRNFTPEQIMDCWRRKVQAYDGDFVSMSWVNEDIGRKGSNYGAYKRRRGGHWPRELPKVYTDPPDYDDDDP